MSVAPGEGHTRSPIWDWRGAPSERSSEDGLPRARRRASLRAGAAAAIGAAVYLLWARTLGVAIMTVACLLLAIALLAPSGLLQALERLFVRLGTFTARMLTWVLMVPLFYLVFLPFGLLFRRGRRDRLKRWLEPDASSYWEAHTGPTAASSSRERQY